MCGIYASLQQADPHRDTQTKERVSAAPRGLIKTKNMSRMLSSKDIGHPDEIRAKKISSRLNRRRISLTAHLTGQVGQADEHGLKRNLLKLLL